MPFVPSEHSHILGLSVLLACASDVEPIPAEPSVRGTFRIGVTVTNVTDPYSYTVYCPPQDRVEIRIRTESSHHLALTLTEADSNDMLDRWEIKDGQMDFLYIDNYFNPSEYIEASTGWVEFDLFEQNNGRVVGLVDIRGDMRNVETDELLWENIHIRGNFDIPRQDSCDELEDPLTTE